MKYKGVRPLNLTNKRLPVRVYIGMAPSGPPHLNLDGLEVKSAGIARAAPFLARSYDVIHVLWTRAFL